MARPPLKPWHALVALGTICYPLLVYFSRDKIPPIAFVIFGLGLIAIRLVTARHGQGRVWRGAMLMAVLILGFTYMIDGKLAVKAYPVVISLSFAALFAFSLFHPPTIIERIARLTEPNLPPEGVAYTRKVTIAWVIFLIANAIISATLALYGSLEIWTLWNSLLSYIAMGLLFVIEYLIRRKVRK